MAGSLIKLVYFSRHENYSIDDERKKKVKERLGISNGNRRSYPILGGRLHFVKFETHKIDECLEFIYSKQLHRGGIVILVPFCLFTLKSEYSTKHHIPYQFIRRTSLCNCIKFTVDFLLSLIILYLLVLYILVNFSWMGIDSHSWRSDAPANENSVIKVFPLDDFPIIA